MNKGRKSKRKGFKIPSIEACLAGLSLLWLLGVLYQLRMLYSQLNMAWLPFFSWTQVPNDTAGLAPLVVPIVLSIWGWIFVCRWLAKLTMLKLKKAQQWRGTLHFLLLLLVWIMVGVLISAILGILPITVFGELSWSALLSATKMCGIFYAYWSLAWLCQQGVESFWISEILKIKLDWAYKMIGKFLPWFIWLALSLSGLSLLLPIYQKSTGTDLCLWRSWDQFIPVVYMNDRFVFSSWAIVSDSWAHLSTWVTVYTRLESDRAIKCPENIKTIKQ